MATYTTSKCPKCNYNFEKFAMSWFSFGDPRVTCPKCKTIVFFKNIREWKFIPIYQKIFLMFGHYIWQNLSYSIGCTILFFILTCIFLSTCLDKSFNETFGKDGFVWIFLIATPIFLLIFILFRHSDFADQIKESKQRMTDPKYREEMEALQNKY